MDLRDPFRIYVFVMIWLCFIIYVSDSMTIFSCIQVDKFIDLLYSYLNSEK